MMYYDMLWPFSTQKTSSNSYRLYSRVVDDWGQRWIVEVSFIRMTFHPRCTNRDGESQNESQVWKTWVHVSICEYIQNSKGYILKIVCMYVQNHKCYISFKTIKNHLVVSQIQMFRISGFDIAVEIGKSEIFIICPFTSRNLHTWPKVKAWGGGFNLSTFI